MILITLPLAITVSKSGFGADRPELKGKVKARRPGARSVSKWKRPGLDVCCSRKGLGGPGEEGRAQRSGQAQWLNQGRTYGRGGPKSPVSEFMEGGCGRPNCQHAINSCMASKKVSIQATDPGGTRTAGGPIRNGRHDARQGVRSPRKPMIGQHHAASSYPPRAPR